jgi:hypothetical protein
VPNGRSVSGEHRAQDVIGRLRGRCVNGRPSGRDDDTQVRLVFVRDGVDRLEDGELHDGVRARLHEGVLTVRDGGVHGNLVPHKDRVGAHGEWGQQRADDCTDYKSETRGHVVPPVLAR